MPDAPLIHQEVDAYKDLEKLIVARAKGEFEIDLLFEKRVEKEENEYQEESKTLHSRFRSEIERLKQEYQQAKAKINTQAQRDTQSTEAEYTQVRQKIETQAKSERSKAKKSFEDSKWQALALFDTGKEELGKRRKLSEKSLGEFLAVLETIKGDAVPVLDRYRAWAGAEPADILDRLVLEQPAEAVPLVDDSEDSTELPEEAAAALDLSDPLVRLQKTLEIADLELGKLERLGLPKFFDLSVLLPHGAMLLSGHGRPRSRGGAGACAARERTARRTLAARRASAVAWLFLLFLLLRPRGGIVTSRAETPPVRGRP